MIRVSIPSYHKVAENGGDSYTVTTAKLFMLYGPNNRW